MEHYCFDIIFPEKLIDFVSPNENDGSHKFHAHLYAKESSIELRIFFGFNIHTPEFSSWLYKGKLEKVFRAIFFIPCVISVVVTSKMWVQIYDSQYGLLNKVLDFLHLGFLKQEWLANPKLVLGSLFVIIMWQGFGWGMLIYYAGIKGISDDVYEAAQIDGAGGFKLFTAITFPLLKPVIKINVTLAMISAFKQMEVIYLTTNGGPGNVSQFLANYLYIKAFNSYQYGYGNAISILFVIVCIFVTVILNKIIKKEVIEY